MKKDNGFENKVDRDVDQAKKDFTALGEDNASGLAKIKKGLVTLGEDGVTGINKKLGDLTDDTKELVNNTVQTINKDVGHGLSQYNTKVQEVADRVPGSFGEKAAGYPWVTITISLMFGLFLGVLIKSGLRAIR